MNKENKKWAINKTFFFIFNPILIKLGEVVVQLHQVSSKLDEKQKSFHYRPFNGSVIR